MKTSSNPVSSGGPRGARVALVALALSACGTTSETDQGSAAHTRPRDASTATAADSGAPADREVADAGDDDAPADDGGAFDATSGPDASDAGAFDATSGPNPSDAGTFDATPNPGDAGTVGCALGFWGEPTELRCTGLYSDWPTRTVAADVHEYDPGLHLWSDGAVKTRWVSLPAGQSIDTSNMDEWVFPNGTKFWKEFVLGGKRVETRLLWKKSDGTWYRTTYRWAADESSAVEVTNGVLDADGHGYEIPSQFACWACHGGRRDNVLGFEAVSLSSPKASGVTMATLAAQGWITAAPSAPIVIPGNATEAAALGYLHANCGTACHNAGSGIAGSTGFHMRLEVGKLSRVEATDTYTTGWNVPTQGFSVPNAATSYRLKSCDTSSSCVFYRMTHRDGVDGTGSGTQMPPIDTHRVDDGGAAAVTAWIDEGCP